MLEISTRGRFNKFVSAKAFQFEHFYKYVKTFFVNTRFILHCKNLNFIYVSVCTILHWIEIHNNFSCIVCLCCVWQYKINVRLILEIFIKISSRICVKFDIQFFQQISTFRDPLNTKKGFFQSYLSVWCCRRLWTR